MNIRTPSALLALVLILCVTQSACASAVTLVDVLVGATEAAVASLQSTGNISPEVAARVNTTLSSAATFADFTITELDSTDSGVTKGLKIAQAAGMVIPPNLPACTASQNSSCLPQALFAAVNAVLAAVAKLSASSQSAAVELSRTDALSFQGGSAKKPRNIKVSPKDKQKLAELKARTAALMVRLKRGK